MLGRNHTVVLRQSKVSINGEGRTRQPIMKNDGNKSRYAGVKQTRGGGGNRGT